MDSPPNTYEARKMASSIDKMRALIANPPKDLEERVSDAMDIMVEARDQLNDHASLSNTYHANYKVEIAKVREELEAFNTAAQIMKTTTAQAKETVEEAEKATSEARAVQKSYERKEKEIAVAADRAKQQTQLKTIVHDAVKSALEEAGIVTTSHLNDQLDKVSRMMTANLLNNMNVLTTEHFENAGLATMSGVRNLMGEVVDAVVTKDPSKIQKFTSSLPNLSRSSAFSNVLRSYPTRHATGEDDEVDDDTSYTSGTATRQARQAASTLSSRPRTGFGSTVAGRTSVQVPLTGVEPEHRTTTSGVNITSGSLDLDALTRSLTDPTANRFATYTPRPLPVHSRPTTSSGPPVTKVRTEEELAGSTEEARFIEAVVGTGEVSGQGVMEAQADSGATLAAAQEPAPAHDGEESLEGKPLKINISTHARIDNSVLNTRMKDTLKKEIARVDRIIKLTKDNGKLACWHTFAISKTGSDSWPDWSQEDFDNNKKCNGCKKHARDRQCFKILDNNSGLLLKATAKQHQDQRQMDVENDAKEKKEKAAKEQAAKERAESERRAREDVEMYE